VEISSIILLSSQLTIPFPNALILFVWRLFLVFLPFLQHIEPTPFLQPLYTLFPLLGTIVPQIYACLVLLVTQTLIKWHRLSCPNLLAQSDPFSIYLSADFLGASIMLDHLLICLISMAAGTAYPGP
jgi:hypothetical protein